jgi:hypothetical protein
MGQIFSCRRYGASQPSQLPTSEPPDFICGKKGIPLAVLQRHLLPLLNLNDMARINGVSKSWARLIDRQPISMQQAFVFGKLWGKYLNKQFHHSSTLNPSRPAKPTPPPPDFSGWSRTLSYPSYMYPPVNLSGPQVWKISAQYFEERHPSRSSKTTAVENLLGGGFGKWLIFQTEGRYANEDIGRPLSVLQLSQLEGRHCWVLRSCLDMGTASNLVQSTSNERPISSLAVKDDFLFVDDKDKLRVWHLPSCPWPEKNRGWTALLRIDLPFLPTKPHWETIWNGDFFDNSSKVYSVNPVESFLQLQFVISNQIVVSSQLRISPLILSEKERLMEYAHPTHQSAAPSRSAAPKPAPLLAPIFDTKSDPSNDRPFL